MSEAVSSGCFIHANIIRGTIKDKCYTSKTTTLNKAQLTVHVVVGEKGVSHADDWTFYIHLCILNETNNNNK